MTFETQPAHRDCDPEQLLHDLQAIGRDRLAQEAAAGPLAATFADFCWHTDTPPTAGHLALWMTTVMDDRSVAGDVSSVLQSVEDNS